MNEIKTDMLTFDYLLKWKKSSKNFDAQRTTITRDTFVFPDSICALMMFTNFVWLT